MTEKRVFTLDRYTKTLLTAIAVLLAVIAVELWAGRPSYMATAEAQVPDSGMQRNQLLAGIRNTNKCLDEILDHLKGKPIKVVIVDPDKADSGRAKD